MATDITILKNIPINNQKEWGHLASTEEMGRASKEDEFLELDIDDINKEEYAHSKQAAHCMIFSESDEKAFDLYNLKAYVMMQMRFDGYLGFPGGLLNSGENRLEALKREIREEMNCEDLSITEEDRIVTHWSPLKKLMLHFYACKVPLETFKKIERNSLDAHDYGIEVLGIIRVPLYTMGDRYRGFPCFLNNTFVGNSKQQLLKSLKHLKLMTEEEIEEARNAPIVY